MSKVTLVVDFDDDKQPSIRSGMDVLGGKLVSFALKDALASQWIDIMVKVPAVRRSVLLLSEDGVVFSGQYHGMIANQHRFYIGSVRLHRIRHWQEPPAALQ